VEKDKVEKGDEMSIIASPSLLAQLSLSAAPTKWSRNNMLIAQQAVTNGNRTGDRIYQVPTAPPSSSSQNNSCEKKIYIGDPFSLWVLVLYVRVLHVHFA